MSIAIPFASGSIDTSRAGYVDATTFSSGSGEDLKYFDITISAVSSISKCEAFFDGAVGATDALAVALNGDTTFFTNRTTVRLTSTTNLRISWSNNTNISNLIGRYYVKETS